jgi:hypothetical protein
LFERVEVLGEVELPRAFRWRGQFYSVAEWGRRWMDEQGQHCLVRVADGNVYELIWVADQSAWWLRSFVRSLRFAG